MKKSLISLKRYLNKIKLENNRKKLMSKIRPFSGYFYPSRLTKIISTLLTHPREIIFENHLVNFAAIVATIGSLVFAAYAPSGVIVVFIISVVIVIIGLFTEAQKYQIYTQTHLPIPIVINIANSANELDALNSLFTLIEKQPHLNNYQKNLQKYLMITQEDLTYKFNGNIFDTENIKDFLKITKHDLEKVKRKTPKDSLFYLVYIGPISVAFLVGSMLAREGMVIFQRDQETNSYKEVIRVADRQLKEKARGERFKIIEYLSQPRQEKVTIAIDAASHKVNLNETSIQEYGDIISLQNSNENTIFFEENWLEYCREIFQIINQKQQEYSEIKLVYSMPVSLAIALGMAIQHFWNIQLTNYDPKSGTYKNLIKINEIIYHY